MFSTGEELVLNGKDRERLCRWFRLESPAQGQWVDHFKGIFFGDVLPTTQLRWLGTHWNFILFVLLYVYYA